MITASRTHAKEIKQTELKIPHTGTPLGEDDVFALEAIQQEWREETAAAQALTNNHVLTDAKFEIAPEPVQRLVEVARKKGHPIYIMPEEKTLHPRLKEMIDGIREGKPYHTFITKKYGETWVLALTLLFGVTVDGKEFKISMRQFASIMSYSYWISLKLKMKCLPLFDRQGNLTEVGRNLVGALFQPGQTAQRNTFLTKMKDPSIPEGERHVHVIYLDADHFRIALQAHESIFQLTSPYGDALREYDAMVFNPIAGSFSPSKTVKFAFRNGLRALATNLQFHYAYNKVFFIRNPNDIRSDEISAVFLYPSETMSGKWHASLNPEGELEVSLRVGTNFTPRIMAEDCAKGMRTIGMPVPGVPDSFVTHSMPVNPPSHVSGHERHHRDWVAALPPIFIPQLNRAIDVLRRFYPNLDECISSILRYLDREVNPGYSEADRFFKLITDPFLKKKGDSTAGYHWASVIILIDIILVSSAWPSAQNAAMKTRLINAMLPCRGSKPSITEIETEIRRYAAAVNNDYLLIGALLLSHYYFRDAEFCKNLLAAVSEQHPDRPLIAVRKKLRSELYFVLVQRGFNDYKFEEELSAMKPEQRAILLSKSVTKANEFKQEEMAQTGCGNTAALAYARFFSKEKAQESPIQDSGSRNLSQEKKATL